MYRMDPTHYTHKERIGRIELFFWDAKIENGIASGIDAYGNPFTCNADEIAPVDSATQELWAKTPPELRESLPGPAASSK